MVSHYILFFSVNLNDGTLSRVIFVDVIVEKKFRSKHFTADVAKVRKSLFVSIGLVLLQVLPRRKILPALVTVK